MDRTHILATLDKVEADLVRLQHRVWSVRRQLQESWGQKVGHQYEDEPSSSIREETAHGR